ncbi:MAG: hypothetical protein PHR77_04070 [Kiritimatiellae bacterium]|nr:hypothetical protein [Kiritimatiellia bacterium]MDD5519343.1 hypothetical protein [Kiritimatiellia bacterium]
MAEPKQAITIKKKILTVKTIKAAPPPGITEEAGGGETAPVSADVEAAVEKPVAVASAPAQKGILSLISVIGAIISIIALLIIIAVQWAANTDLTRLCYNAPGTSMAGVPKGSKPADAVKPAEEAPAPAKEAKEEKPAEAKPDEAKPADTKPAAEAPAAVPAAPAPAPADGAAPAAPAAPANPPAADAPMPAPAAAAAPAAPAVPAEATAPATPVPAKPENK